MANKLISFLGDGRNYQESEFKIHSHPQISGINYRLFPSSIIHFLRVMNNIEFERIIFVGTNFSFETCKELIEKEIKNDLKIDENKIFKILLDQSQIQNGEIALFIQNILNQLVNHLNDGDVVYIDTTHSFRFIPFVSTVLSFYLQTVFSNLKVRLYYGLFDITSKTTNLLDFSELTDITDWIYAVKLFVDFGYTGPFSVLLSKKAGMIYKDPKYKEKPTQIKRLSMAFNDFSTSVRSGMWQFIRDSIDNLDKNLKEEKLRSEIERFIPELTPILGRISDKVESVKGDELESQRKMISFYLSSMDLGMAYRLAREYVISCGVYALGNSDKLYDRDQRENVARLINERIDLTNNPDFKRISSIMQIRNVFAHFGFNKDAESVRLNKAYETLKEFVEKFDTSEKLVEFLRNELVD